MIEQEIFAVNKAKEKRHIGFIVKMLIFLALIYAKNIMEISIPVSLLLVMSAFIVVTGDRDEIIILGICCIPLSSSFQYKYTLLMCIIVYFLKYRKDIEYNSYILPLVFMMLWEGLHAFAYAYSLNEYLRSFAELLFCTFFMINMCKSINYPLLCRMLAFSTIVMCFIVLMNLLESTGYDFEGIFTGTYRFGVGDKEAENFGANYNANALGFMCNLSIVGLLQLASLKKQKATDYAMIVGLMFFGFLTMSRSFIICLASVFVMFVLSRKGGIAGNIKTIIGIGVIIGATYYIMTNYASFIIEGIFERFQEKDVSGGRVDLISFYNKHIFSDMKYLLFGLGLQDLLPKVYRIYRTKVNVCHNGIQELLLVWGIPGLVMFIWFIKKMIESARSTAKGYKLINFAPLLLITLYVQSGQLITSGQVLLSLAFAYMSMCVNFKEEMA